MTRSGRFLFLEFMVEKEHNYQQHVHAIRILTNNHCDMHTKMNIKTTIATKLNTKIKYNNGIIHAY